MIEIGAECVAFLLISGAECVTVSGIESRHRWLCQAEFDEFRAYAKELFTN